MSDRADGYMTGIAYTYDYYPELNPLHMRLGLLNAGFAPPDIATACELGCGQGISLVLHATASRTRWFGTDVNSDHVTFARTLAQASGADVRLFDEPFAAFGHRSDLPAFDFVVLHGVWSWITEENRQVVVEFVRRRLKPGGVLFISYNALPGSAAFGPVRHLLAEHARVGGGGVILERVDAAIDFVDSLSTTNPGYLQDNPKVAAGLDKLKREDRRYLAHEYFSRDWTPMHFSAVAECLSTADLSFACSASYFEAVDSMNLDEGQRSLLAGVENPIFRQTVRDFMINQRFRKDYWIKTGRRLSARQRDEALLGERVILIADQAQLPIKIRAVLALNRGGPREAAVSAVLAVLADYRSRTLGEIQASLPDISFRELVDSLLLLVAYQRVAAAQDTTTVTAVEDETRRLNAWLLAGEAGDRDIRHLASPITGGGVRIGDLHRRHDDRAESERAILRALGIA